MDQHIVRPDNGNPEIRLFASAGSQQTYLEVTARGMTLGLHITRYQAAELIAALQDVENELAAREVVTALVACPVIASELVPIGDAFAADKCKAPRVVEPGCYEVDRDGNRIETAKQAMA